MIAARATGLAGERTTSHGGACAVSSTLVGLTFQTPTSVAAIGPIPASQPGMFLSCLDDALVFDGTRLQVAILLDAHHPGDMSADLWGASPVPGHAGLVELRPPPQFGFNVDTGSHACSPRQQRLAYRRWTPASRRRRADQHIKVLDSIRITRLDAAHG